MYSTRLRRVLARATRVFPVDPDRDLAAAVGTAESLLRRGYSVVWFPEGRRSPTGKLTSFQPGVGVLLRLGIAAALPTAIRGTFDAWPKHRKRPKLNTVRVRFGAPLRFSPTEHPDTERVRADLEQAVRELLERRDT